jgi:hypothetical protein
MRKLLPYLLTTILFGITYVVSQISSDESFIWLYGRDSHWITMGKVRIDFQRIVFTELIAYAFVLISAYEIIATNTDKFARRLIKSLMTIFIIYFVDGLIYYKIIDNGIPNMYEYRGGVPANINFIVAIIFSTIGLIVLEIIRFIVFKIIARERLRKFLPNWVLEQEP